jgi:hypothetical protein
MPAFRNHLTVPRTPGRTTSHATRRTIGYRPLYRCEYRLRRARSCETTARRRTHGSNTGNSLGMLNAHLVRTTSVMRCTVTQHNCHCDVSMPSVGTGQLMSCPYRPMLFADAPANGTGTQFDDRALPCGGLTRRLHPRLPTAARSYRQLARASRPASRSRGHRRQWSLDR